MTLRFAIILTLLLACAACRAAAPTDHLTTASPSPRPSLLAMSTITPRQIITVTAGTAPTVTPAPPTATPPISTPIQLSDELPPAPLDGSPVLLSAESVIGYSLAGRPLTALRFGSGSRLLMLVGGIHGGWEANTVALMQQLIDHFANLPQDIPPGVALVIVPLANPDGYQLGRVARGRFNGAGVDLNRNWSCGWSSEAYWRQERVDAGASPFSEPETRALADYILQLRPAGALFFHSAANGVFAGACDGDHGSNALAAVFGESAGYPYGAPFSAYPVTGTAATWADGEGIPAADVELRSSTDSEYERNLRGVLALLQWLAASP